jgi:hypothetical protein
MDVGGSSPISAGQMDAAEGGRFAAVEASKFWTGMPQSHHRQPDMTDE